MHVLTKTLKRLFSLLAFLEVFVCYAGLLLVTFLVFFNVLNRYWLRFEIMWVGDFSLYIFMIFVFFAIAFTTREKGHTAVEILPHKLFKKLPGIRKGYGIFISFLSILTAVLFAIPVYRFAARSIRYPQYGTLVRWFNTSWIMQTMFIIMILVTAHLLQRMIVDAQMKSSRTDLEEE
jgi:TRAP-type C4-dicarboxylate transport system permease small subunit